MTHQELRGQTIMCTWQIAVLSWLAGFASGVALLAIAFTIIFF